MSADQWGNIVVTLTGLAFLVAAAIVGLVVPKRHLGRYLAVTGYLLLFPVHLWFWQFLLTRRGPLPGWYVPNAAQQVIVAGIVPLVWLCFHRPFRPWLTALALAYVVSDLLQFFSYIYWSYGTTKNFTVAPSHLDSFYFALGTLGTGTGNILAISETSRGLQTIQIGIDLLLIVFVIAIVLARYASLFDRERRTGSAERATTRPARSAMPERSGTGWPATSGD